MRTPNQYHKLTDAQRDEVAYLYWKGKPSTIKIGSMFGVSYQNVIQIGKSRPHIKEIVEREENLF